MKKIALFLTVLSCIFILCACGDLCAEGHTEVIDPAKEATCSETGLTEGRHCSVCGMVLVKQKPLPRKEHIEVTDAAVPPTCEEKGLSEGSHCSVCGKVIVKQREVKATGHTVVKDSKIEATCTEEGLSEGSHCSVCGKVIVSREPVPKKTHTASVRKRTKPTCTEDGRTEEKYCSVCGVIIEPGEVISALGHKPVTDSGTEPDCMNEGLSEGTHCTVCGEVIVKQEKIPARGHIYSEEWTVDSPATDTDNGVMSHHCLYCDSRADVRPVRTEWSYGLSYKVNGDKKTCIITGIGSCEDSYIKIPSELDGYTVTAIEKNAFMGLWGIYGIEIPNTVIRIGERAFYNNFDLKEINIPESVRNIGQEILFGDYRLETVYFDSQFEREYRNNYDFFGNRTVKKIVFNGPEVPAGICYNCTSLQEAVIGDNVKKIGVSAFCGSGLVKFSSGNNVEVIGGCAFSECIYLTEVALNEGLKELNNAAFQDCKALKSIEIPESVTYIGSSMFRYCSSLESLVFPKNLKTLVTDYMCFKCASLKSIEIPDFVTDIGEKAFEGCKGLLYIKYPKNLKTVDKTAFSGCTNVTSVTFPYGITVVPERLCYGMKNLTEAELPSTVTSIGKEAFSFSGLKKVNIPDLVTTISDRAFEDTLIEEINLPNRISSIGEYAFSNTNIRSVVINKNIKSVGNYAFYKCDLLEKIEVRSSGTVMGQNVFKDCNKIREYTFPEGVTEIPSMFSGCTSLERVVLPSSAKSIAAEAFSGCINLKEINIPEGVETIGYSVFSGCYSIEKLILPKSLRSIERAFKECGLSMIWYCGTYEDWKKVNSIFPYDERYKGVICCTDLIIDFNGKTYGNNGPDAMFATTPNGNGTVKITRIIYNKSKDVVIPSYIDGKKVTEIGRNYAVSEDDIFDPFMECVILGQKDITSITIPATVTRINSLPFFDCGNAVIYYEGTANEWLAVITETPLIGKRWFSDYDRYYGESMFQSEAVYCSDGIVISKTGDIYPLEDGDKAFYATQTHSDGTVSITDFLYSKNPDIVIPDKVDGMPVTVIEDSAFALATGILREELNDAVDEGYDRRSLITSVTIPKSIRKIKHYAFRYCSFLKDIYYEGTIEEWGKITKEELWFSDSKYGTVLVHCTDGDTEQKYSG